MALFRRNKKSGPRGSGRFSPFTAGLITLIILALATGWVFTKINPFANPYELKAAFQSANNLKPESPVRIAGVTVGKVKKVEPFKDGRGAAKVTMVIEKAGLPIHKDAELKVRPRIFLEGNFFVDIQPGSPSSPEIKSGHTIPMNQTAAPVQFGQLLTALQSDTREDLRTFLAEYSLKGLRGDGARGFNRSIRYWEDAYRNTALANDALLGTEGGDLGRLLRGQADVSAALARNPEALKDFVSDFNTTAAAFAREDDMLQATIPALRDVLRVGVPALESLNGALPSLSAFARDALPGTISSGPTIDASLPFIRQARLLVSEGELKGLSRDLRATIPALTRLNRSTIGFLNENRTLSACQNQVLLPFAKNPIPDPDFPENTGPFFKQAPRSLVGLSGESRINDGNTPLFRLPITSGPQTLVNTGENGERFLSQSAFPVGGVRPDRPAKQPSFRPDEPCENQDAPDLNALKGPPDATIGPAGAGTGGPITGIPGLPIKQRKEASEELDQIVEHIKRDRKGLPSVDPFIYDDKTEAAKLKELGLKWGPKGRVLKLKDQGGEK